MDAEILCERLLLLVEISPLGFRQSDDVISDLLWVTETTVANLIKECVETGLIYRWFDGESKTRVLSLEPKEKIQEVAKKFPEILSKEKKESRQRKKRNTFFSPKIIIDLSYTDHNLNQNNFSPQKSKAASLSADLEVEEKPSRVIVPGVVLEVVNFWNGFDLRKVRVAQTRIFNSTWNKINRLRAGTYKIHYQNGTPCTRTWTNKEINKSIQKFALAALDNRYYPKPYVKKKMRECTLSDFLYNETLRTSYLLEYHEKELELMPGSVVLREDKYPRITQIYKEYYVGKILGGKFPDKGFTNKEENKFREGAERTVKFYTDNKDKFLSYAIIGGMSAYKLASWVCESIEKNLTSEIPLMPGFFCSDYTFDRRLPAFLIAEGIWEE